ncbi:vacuolar sorting-associated 16-like protein [Labeo rohita]|uniref:Vacuolar protein sorting-associated protein 16 homolog n=1 Tax=Labeo rohita TaxID=84645 RepID=A0A498NNY5_LABRO|nr:vacuolar sorting-associated 16-like protein [Labeo rohita]
MAFVTANWNPLGEAFYRKIELYEMGWNLKDGLRECLVAAAPYGGPIALLKGHNRRSPSARPQLEIYSSSGVPLASFPWKSGVVKQLGWTVSDDLLCVQEDGTVLVYDLLGGFKRHFSMGNEVSQSQVLETKIFHSPYGTGVAILTGALRFTLATNIDDIKLRRLPEVQVISIWRSSLTLAMCGWEKLSEVDTKIKSPPKQMAWCRRPKSQQPSAVVMWDGLLAVVGECKETIQYHLDDDSILVPELDGVRIISGTHHELLQEVPGACEEIFKIASMAPGALLLEAHKEYEKESQKADEYLREIKEQSLLSEAVRQCVEAAGHEHEPETQKTLLRAASFGKCFLSNFPPEQFVSMCRDLRVLNAVRDYTVGIPLTHTQFKQMTVQVLIDRLVYRKLYPLAIEVCRYLKTPEYQGVSRVLKHWACYKVQQKEESDEGIAKAVSVKLADAAGISYSEIATKAYESGRTELAIKLLEFEPRSGEQVPLLLKMKKSPLALSKAIESGDTDLGTHTFTYMFQNFVKCLPRFCKHQEQDTLKDLFNQDDDHEELGNFYVKASYKEQRLEARIALLQSAVDEYYKAKNEFSAKTTEDEMRLLRFQRKLEEEKGELLVGFSLHETMIALLSVGLHKHAEQLYKDFRVPDKRFWWLKLKALAEKEDWEELEKFAKSKKSPIGYLPFVEICIKHHNKYEAKKYVSKVTPEQKVKAHLAVGDMEGAAEAAIERRNESEISTVLARCSTTSDHLLMERLNRAKATVAKK